MVYEVILYLLWLQFYDAAMPKPAEAAAPAAGADISALIAQEVQAIKKPEKRLFNFIKTHVNGLLFLDMAKDIGVLKPES